MLLFLISCFSFSFLLKISMRTEWRLLLDLSALVVSWFQKGSFAMAIIITKSKKKRTFDTTATVSLDEEDNKRERSLLDLPELVIESILEKLPPSGLCRMGAVCSSLRERCKSDHLWEKHLNNKWGRLIGDSAYKEWHLYVVSKKREILINQTKQAGFFKTLFAFWPFSSKLDKPATDTDSSFSLPYDSKIALYVSLQTGQFSFPAQVYNRENGNIGFMLSCYDAQLCYDAQTDTFQARYSPHGRQTKEEDISWERIRAPPVDTPSHVLHISDCLKELKPGNHIEIQWRRNKEFPYGWWYGVVGHMESCDRNENHCICHLHDTVVLEFSQYPVGSQWRQTMISRRDHREVGNEADGFYGGIRKLYKDEEIAMWMSLRPKQALE